MRLTFVLSLIGLLQVSAVGFSQKKNITISSNKIVLSEVFEEVEKNSDYKFFFNNDEVDASTTTSVKVSNADVYDVLDEALKGLPYLYKVLDDNLIFVHKKNTATSIGQESIRVSGVITDDLGEPLPGVNVFEKSAPTNGVITGIDGKYSLAISDAEAIIVYSYIGFKTQEINAAGRSDINITLVSDSEQLDDVVVVGYGVQRREALTSSVSTVKGSDLQKVSATSFDKALQGNTAGVVVSSAVGNPGSYAEVVIRGSGSINASNSPLYIVDGVPVLTGRVGDWADGSRSNFLSSMNSNDIENVTIMKDAAATAIYGSRASNGVIIITTKSGKKGKTKVSVNVEKGVSTLTNVENENANSADLVNYFQAASRNAGELFDPEGNYADWYDPLVDSGLYFPNSLADTDFDWWDAYTQTGAYDNYNVNISGGDEKTNFFVSAGYLSQEGTVVGTAFDRFSGRVNLNHEINKYIKIGNNLQVSRSKQDYVSDGWAWANPVAASFWTLPFYESHTEDGEYNQDLGGSNGNYNALQIIDLNSMQNRTVSIVNSTFVELAITKNLKAKSTFGLDWKDVDDDQYFDPAAANAQSWGGGYYAINNKYYKWNISNTLTYNKIFNGSHSLNVLLGQEAREYNNWWIYAGGANIDPDIPYLDGTSSDQEVGGSRIENAGISYFTNASYSYNSKYYFGASIRRDASSKFGANNKWATFSSFSLGYTLSNEDFFDVSWVNNLKIRASYGETGNSGIDSYASKGLYQADKYNSNLALYPSQIENADLTWESAQTTNVGVDFGLFSRFTGTVEYYIRNNNQLLINQEISQTSGQSSILVNSGEILNKGLEVALSSQNVKGRNFQWTTDINFTLPSSEIISLGDGMEEMSNGSFQKRRVGGKFTEWNLYKYAGVNPDNGMALWYDEDGGKTEDYDQAARDYVGSPEPDIYGSMTNTLSFKGIEFSFMFYGVSGNEVMFSERVYREHDGSDVKPNGSGPVTAYVANNFWTTPGQITDVPKPIAYNNTQSNEWISTRWLEDGSYLRLKTIKLGYSLPKTWVEKAFIQNAHIYCQATNLITWSNVTGLDPEVGVNGYSYNAVPNSRTFIFGVNLDF
ncbi:TonB-dependent receptor [Carboxylicivirga sp. M1479]|uniref:TonB-dependent receptor n=1 Tax=Carboxylicivirga sp. M1479 TaxID=2594476 RepID=UPI00163DE44F|nr:TonB-dependent receptor [Carboxylicivirga sp. M1479]